MIPWFYSQRLVQKLAQFDGQVGEVVCSPRLKHEGRDRSPRCTSGDRPALFVVAKTSVSD